MVVSVLGLVERIVALDWAVADEPAVADALTDSRRLRCSLDSIDVVAARRLAEHNISGADRAAATTLPRRPTSVARALTKSRRNPVVATVGRR